MAEVLNRMLTKAVEQGFFKGIQVGSQSVSLSHLQFDDDTLLFCEPKMEYLKNIENILYSFQSFSGLTVNYEKSGIIAIGKEDEWTARATEMLKCRAVKLPIIYLGIPLGENMRRISAWQPIVDKVQQRLTAWKAATLSRAGRLVLIKAVLSSLPVYYLSMFKMPKKVALEINKIQRKFLWNSKHNCKTAALVKWEIVQRPKKEGGLGVGDLTIKNAALLFKWWWRYACEEGAAWRSVIQSIYEEEDVILPSKDQIRISGPWKTIKQLALKESPVSAAFFKHLSLRLGAGTRLRFWQDTWAGERPLKVLFPMLFSLSMQKYDLIANMGWFEGQTWRWTLAWAREMDIVEQEQLDALQTLLQHTHPQRGVNDQALWKGKESFSTKALIAEANTLNRGSVAVDNLASTVWMKIAPPKVEFMTWLALLGKLNTRDLLQRKGIITAEVNTCTFCAAYQETGDHLLMGCVNSWRVWENIAEELGISIEAKQTYREFYEWWMSRRVQNPVWKKFIIVGFFATTWSIWQKRNMMIFQEQTYDHQSLCQTIKWRMCLWSKTWKEDIHHYTTEELVRQFRSIPRLFG